MAKIRIKLRASIVSGKPGTIFYQVTHKQGVKQITTGMHIQEEEWSRVEEQIRVEALMKNPRLATLQRMIDEDVERIQLIIRSLELSGANFSVQDIVRNFSDTNRRVCVLDYLKEQVVLLKMKGKRSTAKNWRSTLNSLSEYLGGVDIPLETLNDVLLSDYEEWLKVKGVKRNTTSFYMRNLRSAYNKAVKYGFAKQAYPFKNVYVGVDKTSKRAVDERILIELKALDLSGMQRLEFARDMFIFSYCTRGMSFIDMAYLKKENIVDGSIRYVRRKTGQMLSVRIEAGIQRIMDYYKQAVCGSYLLPIIKSEHEEVAYRQYQTQLRYYNKQLKKLAKMLGNKVILTSYVSRHSWASMARKLHVPIAVIRDAMGHESEKTTQIYLASLNEEVIDEANAKIVALIE